MQGVSLGLVNTEKFKDSQTGRTIGNVTSSAVLAAAGAVVGGPAGFGVGLAASSLLWDKPLTANKAIGIGAGAAGLGFLSTLLPRDDSDQFRGALVERPIFISRGETPAQPVAYTPEVPKLTAGPLLLLAAGGVAIVLLLRK